MYGGFVSCLKKFWVYRKNIKNALLVQRIELQTSNLLTGVRLPHRVPLFKENRMKILDQEQVVANYYCDKCGEKQINIPVQESIYTGAPMCIDCNLEMSLDQIYIKDY